MSRRERISDFTRPVVRGQVSDSNHVYSRTSGSNGVRRPIPRDNPLLSRARVATSSRPAQSRQNKSTVLRRQGLKKLPAFVPRKPPKRINIRIAAPLVLGIIVVMATPMLLFAAFQHRGSVMGAKDIFGVSNSELPKYLTSSSIMDVAVKIKPITSIDNDNRQLDDLNYLGWYEKSSKPGTPGAVLFVGGVSKDENIGPFHNIVSFKKGDSIQIETGDGRLIIYVVSEVRKYAPKDIPEAELLKPIVPDKEGLNLLTYTDQLDKNSELGKYQYVVFAAKE